MQFASCRKASSSRELDASQLAHSELGCKLNATQLRKLSFASDDARLTRYHGAFVMP